MQLYEVLTKLRQKFFDKTKEGLAEENIDVVAEKVTVQEAMEDWETKQEKQEEQSSIAEKASIATTLAQDVPEGNNSAAEISALRYELERLGKLYEAQKKKYDDLMVNYVLLESSKDDVIKELMQKVKEIERLEQELETIWHDTPTTDTVNIEQYLLPIDRLAKTRRAKLLKLLARPQYKGKCYIAHGEVPYTKAYSDGDTLFLLLVNAENNCVTAIIDSPKDRYVSEELLYSDIDIFFLQYLIMSITQDNINVFLKEPKEEQNEKVSFGGGGD